MSKTICPGCSKESTDPTNDNWKRISDTSNGLSLHWICPVCHEECANLYRKILALTKAGTPFCHGFLTKEERDNMFKR